ncbi:MAG TPA: YciI family protein [Thermoleophilaceae bacterium]
MKYLILIHHNQRSREAWEAYTEAERAAGIRAHVALVEDLAESGEMVMSEALADPSHARRVHVRDGKTTTSDGPFAEVKEHLAGFYLVECETIDRAIEHAARIPEAAFGNVEVRPVLSRNGVEM